MSVYICVYIYMANADAHASYNVMEEFIEKRREAAPAGMKTMFQTDTLVPALGWTWMLVEDALVSVWFSGLGLGRGCWSRMLWCVFRL